MVDEQHVRGITDQIVSLVASYATAPYTYFHEYGLFTTL